MTETSPTVDEQRSPLILITDDDNSLRSLLMMALRADGYVIEEAVNGQECLVKYQRLQPDLVLLDAIMPEMDGFTCCEQLRQFPQSRNIPILMITFLDDRESIEQAFTAGATDYITKPIHWSVLKQRVRYLLSASQSLKQGAIQQQQLDRQLIWQEDWSEFLAQLAEVKSLTTDLVSGLEPLREGLGIDRFVVYGADLTPQLESVAANSPSALDYSLLDLGLNQLLPSGEILAIADITQSSLSPASKTKLKDLQTAALLLIPIGSSSKPLGWLGLYGQFTGEWDSFVQGRCQDLANLFALVMG